MLDGDKKIKANRAVSPKKIYNKKCGKQFTHRILIVF